jgi:hypothetical protein
VTQRMDAEVSCHISLLSELIDLRCNVPTGGNMSKTGNGIATMKFGRGTECVMPNLSFLLVQVH